MCLGGLKSRLARRCTPKWFVDFVSAGAQEIAIWAATWAFGADTDAIFLRAGGIPGGCARRLVCTTVETTDLRDLEAISTVYAKFCQDLAADFDQRGDAYQPFIPDYSS